MAKLKITLIRSSIGSTKRQKATLAALGLRKMHHSVEHDSRPHDVIPRLGMLKHCAGVGGMSVSEIEPGLAA